MYKEQRKKQKKTGRKGGTGKEYFKLMKDTCERARKTLVSFGDKYTSGINELPRVLKFVEQGRLGSLSRVNSSLVMT